MGRAGLEQREIITKNKLYAWAVSALHHLPSWEFMIGSPCEVTFCRTPSSSTPKTMFSILSDNGILPVTQARALSHPDSCFVPSYNPATDLVPSEYPAPPRQPPSHPSLSRTPGTWPCLGAAGPVSLPSRPRWLDRAWPNPGRVVLLFCLKPPEVSCR